MKKINILGVGNALVDKQFLIDESFLKEISIDKGTMGLCDENYQENLLKNFLENLRIVKTPAEVLLLILFSLLLL